MLLISVVISAYNAKKFIQKCVKYYMDQTYPNIELILFDDASTDDTRELMFQAQKEYPNKIRVFWSDVNLGPGGGKDAGKNQAKGEYIIFGDCDDPVETDYIENLVKTALENDMPDLVIGGFKKVTPNHDVIYERVFKDKEDALFQSITNCGKLFKTSFLRGNDLNLPKGKVLEDVIFQGCVIVRNPSVAVCLKSGYHYLRNPESFSNNDLNRFVPNSLENEILALSENYLKLTSQTAKELFLYYVFRCVCWHLLKSGCGVGKDAMSYEYQLAFSALDNNFSGYKRCKFISLIRPKHERLLIRLVVGSIAILHKLHLSKLFFSLYARLKILKKLWPDM